MGDPDATIHSYGSDFNGRLIRNPSIGTEAQTPGYGTYYHDLLDWREMKGGFTLLKDAKGFKITDEKMAEANIKVTQTLVDNYVRYDKLGPNSNTAAFSSLRLAGVANLEVPGWGLVVGSDSNLLNSRNFKSTTLEDFFRRIPVENSNLTEVKYDEMGSVINAGNEYE